MKSIQAKFVAGFGLLAMAAMLAGCGGGSNAPAAQKVYVKPGEHDAYYAFLSGGHSGQVYVYGMPSCRHITTIPVFTPEPAARLRLRRGIEGDAGRLHLGRRAPSGPLRDRRRLRRPLAVHQRHAERPHRPHRPQGLQDPRRSSARSRTSRRRTPARSRRPTPSTCSRRRASRCRCPTATVRKVEDYAKDFHGIIAGIKVDPKDGTMSMGFEILMPPFDWDLSDAGKGPSHGLAVLHLLQQRDGATTRSRSRRRRTRWTTSPRWTGARRRRRSTRARPR